LRTAYFNLIGGVSGDMLLGALVDVGLPVQDLQAELSKLDAGGFTLKAEKTHRGMIGGTLLRVELDETGRRRRKWSDFIDVIARSRLDQTVKATATAVFERLIAAEKRVHGSDHASEGPHELGTVDTLVDVVGVAAGLKMLGVDRIFSSAVPAGAGMVRTEHGVLPVPAPATLEILTAAGVPVRVPGPLGPEGEAATPTGAALISELATFAPADISIQRTGYGLGSRNPAGYPNVVGVWLGTAARSGAGGDGLKAARGVTLLETNIDDMSGELFGYVQERLFEAGARDVWLTPIQMKKNRPGVVLSALVPDALVPAAATLILKETSTLGVRVRAVERFEAEREIVQVKTTLGQVPVKVKRLDGKVADVSPEYEACRAVARESGIPLAEVMRRVAGEAERILQDGRSR
jgi:uncharacterized protein (TIGR00299 family) protein